jgi:CheY-like chemotaxis protein
VTLESLSLAVIASRSAGLDDCVFPLISPFDEQRRRQVLAPLHVLLADDNPDNRRLAELILSSAGARVTPVKDGAEAVDAFRNGPFDLVLLDMMMPVMGGAEAVRAIRRAEADGVVARTPVIMLSADTLPEHVERSLEAGADRHLAKPITATALIEAISLALDAAVI